MNSRLLALSITLLSPGALAQVSQTDILVNLFDLSSSIDHYRADGTLVQQLNAGTGDLWEGAALTPTGEVVCTRRNTNGVNVFDPVTGTEVGTFDVTTNSGVLGDVSVFSDGTLAVVAQQDGTIELFTLTGTFVQTFAPATMSHPFGCHVDGRDHLWVCDVNTNSIYELDRAGTLLNEFSLPFEPSDMIVAPDGTLWIASWTDRTVQHYTASGAPIGSFPTGVLGDMFGIAMAGDGTLWVSGSTDGSLHQYDQFGVPLGSFPIASGGSPTFITIGMSCDRTITSYCTAGTTSSGCHATMAASGTTSLANASPFTLSCTNVEGNKNGIFFYGITGRVASSWGIGGNTWLCVKAPTQRMLPLLASGGAPGTCTGSFSADWNAYVAANPAKPINQALTFGSLVSSQAWFRDPASGTGPLGAKGTALSDAIEFAVCP